MFTTKEKNIAFSLYFIVASLAVWFFVSIVGKLDTTAHNFISSGNYCFVVHLDNGTNYVATNFESDNITLLDNSVIHYKSNYTVESTRVKCELGGNK